MKITKAIIPAAGLGTRVLPATKAMPKEMLPIVDKPSIQYIVEEAVASGITDILIITNRGKGIIEDHFDRSPQLEYSLELSGKAEMLEQLRAISDMANIYTIRQRRLKDWDTQSAVQRPLQTESRSPYSTAMMLS